MMSWHGEWRTLIGRCMCMCALYVYVLYAMAVRSARVCVSIQAATAAATTAVEEENGMAYADRRRAACVCGLFMGFLYVRYGACVGALRFTSNGTACAVYGRWMNAAVARHLCYSHWPIWYLLRCVQHEWTCCANAVQVFGIFFFLCLTSLFMMSFSNRYQGKNPIRRYRHRDCSELCLCMRCNRFVELTENLEKIALHFVHFIHVCGYLYLSPLLLKWTLALDWLWWFRCKSNCVNNIRSSSAHEQRNSEIKFVFVCRLCVRFVLSHHNIYDNFATNIKCKDHRCCSAR